MYYEIITNDCIYQYKHIEPDPEDDGWLYAYDVYIDDNDSLYINILNIECIKKIDGNKE